MFAAVILQPSQFEVARTAGNAQSRTEGETDGRPPVIPCGQQQVRRRQ
jgi:hypothetical protein